MDARYNMINWVHRSSRGWSYGSGIVDPRTGEVIKGNVTLGSLRIRQDYMLGTGLIPVFGDAARGTRGVCELGAAGGDDAEYLAQLDSSNDSARMSLARIRQLAAHEVGHALGLSHNFAASTYGRASVMDYPAPMVGITDGKLDFSRAYATGMGDWDIQAIRYAYSELPSGTNERAALSTIIQENLSRGLIFLTDQDARPEGSASPLAHLWDNGESAVEGLRQALAVRRIGLAGFGERNIAPGQPLALLNEVLVPLYLHHRYQLEATSKLIGGVQ